MTSALTHLNRMTILSQKRTRPPTSIRFTRCQSLLSKLVTQQRSHQWIKATTVPQEKVFEWLGELEVERISVKHELLPHFSTVSKSHEHDERMR
jgi:hypothetical protein